MKIIVLYVGVESNSRSFPFCITENCIIFKNFSFSHSAYKDTKVELSKRLTNCDIFDNFPIL